MSNYAKQSKVAKKRTNKHKQNGFTNNTINNNNDIELDEVTFIQMLEKVFVTQQMSLNKGIKMFGDRAVAGMTKELRQLHMRKSFIPRLKSSLTKKEWANMCEAVNLIKEKSSGENKGRCCADG